MCFSEGVPRGQGARTESSQASDVMDTMDNGNNSTLGTHHGKKSKNELRIDLIFMLQMNYFSMLTFIIVIFCIFQKTKNACLLK